MSWRVTFIGPDLAQTVDHAPDRHVAGHHGLPGSLLDIALAHGIPVEHACGGNAACTTCHVYIREGADRLSPLEDEEADRLDSVWDLRPNSRLACQAVVRGEVVCEIPEHTRNQRGR